MGPVFVKLGQTLSTRPDIIGDEACEALGELQDQMPQFNDIVAFNTISEEINWAGPICPEDTRPGLEGTTTLFKELTMKPVSAASLGQVYKGMTHEGVEVAVKVQRPALLPAVSRDLYLLRVFLEWWEKTFQSGAVTPEIADSLGDGILSELDYFKEAANMDAFRVAHEQYAFMAVPRWLPKYTGKRVLTTEWVNGRKLSQLAPADQVLAAQYSVEASVAQLLMTGVLHADPHEGNLLFGDDRKLHFLDFGLLSIMKPNHMEGMAQGILHLIGGDWVGLLQDFGDMEILNPPFLKWDYDGKPKGWKPIPKSDFEKAFITCLKDSGDQSNRTSFGELFAELASIGMNYRFACPAYYVLVMRSFVTLEGVAARADPDFNIYTAAAPYAVRRGLTPRTPSGERALRDALLNKRGELKLEELHKFITDAADPDRSVDMPEKVVRKEGKARFGSPNASLNSFDEWDMADPRPAKVMVDDKTPAERVLETVEEVLLSSDGRALRRVLYNADSNALVSFISSSVGKTYLRQTISATLAVKDKQDPVHVTVDMQRVEMEHHVKASARLQQEMVRVICLHHLQRALKASCKAKLQVAAIALTTASLVWRVVLAGVLAQIGKVVKVPFLLTWKVATSPARFVMQLFNNGGNKQVHKGDGTALLA